MTNQNWKRLSTYLKSFTIFQNKLTLWNVIFDYFLTTVQVRNQKLKCIKDLYIYTFLDLTWLVILRQLQVKSSHFLKKSSQVKSSHHSFKKFPSQVKSSHRPLENFLSQVIIYWKISKSSQVKSKNDLTWLDSSQKWLDLPISGCNSLWKTVSYSI